MTLKLYANGKHNPLGLDNAPIRLTVETELLFEFDYVEFKLYNSIDDKNSENPFWTSKQKDLACVFDASDFSPFKKVFWQAIIVCKTEKVISDIAFFETGLQIDKKDEKWIENPNFDRHVSEFVAKFTLDQKPIKARLCIVGLGYYQSFINGKKTDENYFKPLLTDFDLRLNIDNVDYDEDNFHNDKKSISLDTYDVTDSIDKGQNQLTVLLGTGWYCNDDKLITDPCDRFGTPKLFFRLYLFFDNKTTVIESDQSVLVRNTHIRSQLFAGDRIDFSAKPLPFINAEVCPSPTGKLVCPKCEHDAVIEELKPISTSQCEKVIEYDFSINHSGGVYLKVKGERGKKLTLNYYEVKTDGILNKHTSEWIAYDVKGPTPIPVDVLYQRDEYVLSGEIDIISPLFHFNCYRYVTLECEGEYQIIEFKSLFISTGIEKDGDFSCSDKFLNDFYNAFIITQRDNMHSGIPSDCPHREKLPYTGDGNLASEPTLYSFRSQEFYRKWLLDVIDAQGNNGWVPYSAPNIGGAGGYWWSNVLTDLPLKLYRVSGDVAVIEQALNPSLKYLEYIDSVHDGKYIIRKSFVRWYLGEWLNPYKTEINVDFVNTMAYYNAVDNVQKMCDILGKEELKLSLQDVKEKIKNAVNDEFFDSKNLCYLDGGQGADLLPLLYGFISENYELVKSKVIERYKQNPFIDTGIILTPVLLDALSEWGEYELCYKLFTRDGDLTFKAMLEGETTLCEHWGKVWPVGKGEEQNRLNTSGNDVSHCHPMFGSVVGWLYKRVAGLDLSNLYQRKVVFRPLFTDYVKSAKAEKMTGRGKISTEYYYTDCFNLKIKIPLGLTGEIVVPKRLGKILTVNGVIKKGSGKKDNYNLVLSGGEYQIEVK